VLLAAVLLAAVLLAAVLLAADHGRSRFLHQ